MKKLNNKGFLMVETIMVSSFVMLVLIILFLQFRSLMVSYNNSYKYNTPTGIYNLKALRDYILENQVSSNSLKIQLNKTSKNYITIINNGTCNNDFSIEDRDFCNSLSNASDFKNVIYTTSDIDNIRNDSTINGDMKRFISKIKSSPSKERLVALYNDGSLATITYGSVYNNNNIGGNSGSVETSTSIYNFNYTGDMQRFTAPFTGNYKLEVWGAEGSLVFDGIPGKGGYSEGIINLSKGQTIYIYVGGKTGYNSGLNGAYLPGGGATHIASNARNNLSDYASYTNELLIVAGGGGAAERVTGGSGGGFKGTDGSGAYSSIIKNGKGGSQTSGGEAGTSSNSAGEQPGSFGKGGSGNATSGSMDSAASGGGGFYGGGGVTYAGGAGGGSGYIGNTSLSNKHMACYNCEATGEESIRTISVTCTNSTPTEDCAKLGNGYARITYLGS